MNLHNYFLVSHARSWYLCYAQRKLDELDEEIGTQDWDNFVKEIMFCLSTLYILRSLYLFGLLCGREKDGRRSWT